MLFFFLILGPSLFFHSMMLFEIISDSLTHQWAQFDHIIDNYHILFTVDFTSSHRIQFSISYWLWRTSPSSYHNAYFRTITISFSQGTVMCFSFLPQSLTILHDERPTDLETSDYHTPRYPLDPLLLNCTQVICVAKHCC